MKKLVAASRDLTTDPPGTRAGATHHATRCYAPHSDLSSTVRGLASMAVAISGDEKASQSLNGTSSCRHYAGVFTDLAPFRWRNDDRTHRS